MTAQQLLALVAPLGVTGLSMPDLADASTWTFTGDCNADTVRAVLAYALLPPSVPGISKFAFLKLLTPAEYGALAMGALNGDTTLIYAKALLDAAVTMTPTEPTFQAMLAYCVSTAILTADRAAALVEAMT